MDTAFDTLDTARDLKAAGFEPDQAGAIARAMGKAGRSGLEHLATKESVAEIRGEMRAIKWVLGFVIAGMLAILGKLYGVLP